MISLKGKTILITGASSGIGAGCAEAFAEAGASLLLWARRTERLQSLAAHLESAFKVSVAFQSVDVRDSHAVADAFENRPADFRTVEVLVNNAGLSRGLNPIQRGEIQDWEEMIDTNLKGLLYVTRVVLPCMVERGNGMVINISSIAARQAYYGGNVYGATKAAVHLLGESMQVDLLGTGVRVCNIDPGLVETEFSLVRYHGDTQRAGRVYKGIKSLTGHDVGEAAVFVATRPSHVSIQNLLITPSAQASVNAVKRDDDAR